MIHPGDYILYVKQAPYHRALLARVALNVLYDADAYPVDISEIQAATGVPAALMRAFLDWCATAPNEHYMRLPGCWSLDEVRAIAAEPEKESAAC